MLSKKRAKAFQDGGMARFAAIRSQNVEAQPGSTELRTCSKPRPPCAASGAIVSSTDSRLEWRLFAQRLLRIDKSDRDNRNRDWRQLSIMPIG